MTELSVKGALISFDALIPLLNKHLNLKENVKREVESIRSFLREIHDFIGRREHRKWPPSRVEEIREIAYDIEDVLEVFALHMPQQYLFHRLKFTQKASKFAHHIKHHFPLREIFHKITDIKNRIEDIKSRKEIFGNGSSTSSPESSSGTMIQVPVNPLNFDDQDINRKLSSFYKNLPNNFKRCLLFFSVFPEGYSVDCGRLKRLWVAERFAIETEGETAEKVAEGYLNKLIQWNLVQVSDGGRPRNCQVHKHVREFIVQKYKDENFVSIISNHNAPNKKLRRISGQSACSCSSGDIKLRACTHWSRNGEFTGVRSLFLFGCEKFFLSAIESRFQEFHVLRVSDLQGSPLTEFPKHVFHLALLRYLSLRDTEIKVIPKTIKKLFSLETLDLKKTNVNQLPKQIWRLKKLQHLYASKKAEKNSEDFDFVQGVNVFQGIENATNLQKLSLVNAGQNVGIIQKLKHLRQLKKLGLTGLKREYGRDLCASIKQMNDLTTLDLCTTTKEEYLELGDLAEPPSYLQRLYLKGGLAKFPDWISLLDNLIRLRLKYSRLKESPLNFIKNLPKLMELELVDCFDGSELIFETFCFKQLKKVVIKQLPELHTVVIADEAMPGLQQMSLCRCQNLKMPPLGINKLAKVEELTLYDMNEEFIASIQRPDQERAMVEHIRSITLDGQVLVI